MFIVYDDVTNVVKDIVQGNLFISTANLIILVTCILTIIYLYIAHIRSKGQIRRAKLELSKLTDCVACGVFILDFETLKITYANDGFYKLSTYTADEIERLFENDPFVLMDTLAVLDEFKSQLAKGSSICITARMKRKDGQVIWVNISGNVTINHKKKRYVYCVITDINDNKSYEQLLEQKEQRYQVALEVSNEILFEYDSEYDVMKFSGKYFENFGTDTTIVNFKINAFNMNVFVDDMPRIHELVSQIDSDVQTIETEYRLQDIRGNYVWMHLVGKKVNDPKQQTTRIYGKLVNIDQTKKQLDSLRLKAERDWLTSLSNKESVKRVVEDYLYKNGSSHSALFVIDIDDFKAVNDSFGHMFGDQVLRCIALELVSTFGEQVTFGRIGGDEFMGFMKNYKDLTELEHTAKLICETLRKSYQLGDLTANVTGSVGVAIGSGLSYEDMYQNADSALYKTKAKNKNDFSINIKK